MSVATSDTANTSNTADEFKHVAPAPWYRRERAQRHPRRRQGLRGEHQGAVACRKRSPPSATTSIGWSCCAGSAALLSPTKVGTPTGTVPVRIVPSPEIADRIVDQISENVHRQDMHENELRDGIEQLALVGVTAAQMTKRLAVPRHTVDAALKVVKNPASKARMDTESLSLEDAAIYAELRTTRTP